jgi:hypothetical protein
MASSSTTELIDSGSARSAAARRMPMAITNSPSTTRSMPTVTPAAARRGHGEGFALERHRQAWIR